MPAHLSCPSGLLLSHPLHLCRAAVMLSSHSVRRGLGVPRADRAPRHRTPALAEAAGQGRCWSD